MIIRYLKTSYRQIANTEIPEPIEITLSEYFEGFKPNKVFKGNDGTYKLVGSLNCRNGILVFNRNGEIIKLEAVGSEKPESKNRI